MRLIFAGTPQFAAIHLRALWTHGHEIVLVLTQPDRPSGRGLRPSLSAVKEVAVEAGLELLQPSSLMDAALQDKLSGLQVDAWVVVAYGLILPAMILRAPRLGCLNVHASLLPRWRGAAPIQRALMAGDYKTGISIMRMDEGLDTGPVLAQCAIPILPDETAASLHDRLAELGAQTLLDVLERLALGPVAAVPQASNGVLYAKKILREDAKIDWSQPAQSVARMIQALNPTPGAYTLLRHQTIKLWRALAHDRQTAQPAGTILDIAPAGIHVACGDGVLIVAELQRAGGKRLSADDFVRGHTLCVGERFSS
jgi:methionyl-tRNA formyltransferase